MAFFLVLWLANGFAESLARAAGDSLALDAKQIVVCLAPDSSSSEGTLQLYHRDKFDHWQADGPPWSVMFARKGLAWGRGLHPAQEGPQKSTGDHRNPMGLFRLGMVLGYAPTLPADARGWPYHQVTERDAWIDDPRLPNYNHLYTLPAAAPFPAWWEEEHMHLDDMAYEWMVIVEHNYDDPLPDAGNEIFFHIRRGEHYRTAGCTTMGKDDIVRLIKWLEPGSNAMLAELTRTEYVRVWRDWHLPPP